MHMEPIKYPSIMRCFSLFLILLLAQSGFACGWSVTPETSRLALFRAERNHFQKLHYFCYSADNFAEVTAVSDADQRRNCTEWQSQFGNKIPTDDIYAILYQTGSGQFQNAYISKNLNIVFKGNAFIAALLLPKNKTYLDYMVYAKKLEYSNQTDGKWESWKTIGYSYDKPVVKTEAEISGLKKMLVTTKNMFLKQRYAFLLLRHDFYSGEDREVVGLYKTYFAKNTGSILQPWAMYYMALCLDNAALKNYYLSKVFVACDDKSFAAIRNFDRSALQPTLALAKNNYEKGILLAMNCIRNPAPALGQLENIQKLIPESEYLSFLVQREVNKLEDWILTPQYVKDGPSVQFKGQNWYDDYEAAKATNLTNDLEYLRKLKTFLVKAHGQVSGEQKDYLSAAIAQLCFIDDDIERGKKYTAMISKEANLSIQLQKNIQLSLIALKQDDLMAQTTQRELFACFDAIESLIQKDYMYFKSLYTLYRIASKAYAAQQHGDLAGLFFLKSENKKYNNNYYAWEYSDVPDYYFYIGYFERFATMADMDHLIALVQKKNKTPFEKYLCSGTTTPNTAIYKDLKGTIAFRNNDLEAAYQVFSEMPSDFWKKTYAFSDYLNENPFYPKVLQYTKKKRTLNYDFNKATFVGELLKLKKQNTADSNMKLAHAYFNVSYWGNSWMMNAYGWTSGDYDYSDYIFGGDLRKREAAYQQGNYYNCNIAKKYYLQALQLSKNKEQQALASLMIFECEYYGYDPVTRIANNAVQGFNPGRSIFDFHAAYRDTNVFRKYNCPLLKSYIN